MPRAALIFLCFTFPSTWIFLRAGFIAVLTNRQGKINMRLSQDVSTASALTLSLATLSLLAQDVFARPAPEPKSAWVRKGHGRKAISDVLKGKRDLRRSTVVPRNESSSCAGTLATELTAPKKNVWGGLEDTDAVAVVAWLFAQPEFNLTVTENATAWDNSV